MTDKQINETIAEACGWIRNCLGGWLNPIDGDFKKYKNIPDYCNDLNRMHEAEEWLLKADHVSFDEYICELMELRGNGPSTWHATARQRAEAFMRTIGKWEE